MAELKLHIDISEVRKVNNELANLSKKQLEITDPKELEKITKQIRLLKEHLGSITSEPIRRLVQDIGKIDTAKLQSSFVNLGAQLAKDIPIDVLSAALDKIWNEFETKAAMARLELKNLQSSGLSTEKAEHAVSMYQKTADAIDAMSSSITAKLEPSIEQVDKSIKKTDESAKKVVSSTDEAMQRIADYGRNIARNEGVEGIEKLKKALDEAKKKAEIARKELSLMHATGDKAGESSAEVAIKDADAHVKMAQTRYDAAVVEAERLGSTLESVGKNGIEKFFGRISKGSKQLGTFIKENQAMSTFFNSLPAPMKSAANSVMSFGKALGGLALTPFGAALMAVTALVEGFKFAMSTTREGMDDLNEKMLKGVSVTSKFKGVWQSVKDSIGYDFDSLLSLLSGDIDEANRLHEKARKAKQQSMANAALIEQTARDERKLAKDRVQWVTESLYLNEKIAQSRTAIYEQTDKLKKLEMIRESRSDIEDKYNREIELAAEELRIEYERQGVTGAILKDAEGNYKFGKETGQMIDRNWSRTAEDFKKINDLQKNILQLQIQQQSQQRMLARQETSTRKAYLKEQRDLEFSALEGEQKRKKDIHSIDEQAHRKALNNISDELEAQLLALDKQEQAAIDANDGNYAKKHEEIEKQRAHVQQMADKKRVKEIRDFNERILKEDTDNALALAKEQISVSTDMNDEIIKGLKKRFGISEELTDKQLLLIEIERKTQLKSLDEQEKKWRKLGEYSEERAAYIAQKRDQINASTDKQSKNAMQKESDSAFNAMLESRSVSNAMQGDSIKKRLEELSIQREKDAHSLERERQELIEQFGEQSKAVTAFDEKRRMLMLKYADDEQKIYAETYETAERQFSKLNSRRISDVGLLKSNGRNSEAIVAERQFDEQMMQMGGTYIDEQARAEYLAGIEGEFTKFIRDINGMTFEELKTQEASLRAELNGFKAMGDSISESDKKRMMVVAGMLDKIGKRSENAEKRMERAAAMTGSVWGGVSDMLAALGEDVDETTAKILESVELIGGGATDMINSIVTMANGTMDATKASAEAAGEAISTAEKASVILAIIQAAMKIVQGIAKLIKTSDQKYEEAAAEQAEINALTSAVNEYDRAVLKAQHDQENWFSSTGLNVLKQGFEEGQKALEDYYTKANEMQEKYVDKKGGSVLGAMLNPKGLLDGGYSNIKGVADMAKYASEQVNALNNLRIETQSSKKGFLGFGARDQKTEDLRSWVKNKMGKDLFDESGMIDSKLAQQVIEGYGDKMQGETKATLEELVKLKEEYDEYLENLQGYVSDMYSPVVDNMTEALMTWLDTGEDVMDSFNDYASDTFRNIAEEMVKSMVREQMFGQYEKDLKDLYSEYSKGGMSITKLAERSASLTKGVVDNFEANAEGLKIVTQSIKEAYDMAGIDITGNGSEDDAATFGGYETMSEETGTELSGRFSAMYIVQSQLLDAAKVGMEKQTNLLDSIMKLSGDISAASQGTFNVGEEALQIMVQSNIELQAINASTASMNKLMRATDERMEQWHSHIMSL